MQKNNKIALWALLSFFVPPAGLVLWLVWAKKEDKKEAKKSIATATIAGVMIYAFVTIMWVCFYSTFIYILYILLAVAVLLFMVLVHELGHYIAGRILKFKITEFSIGFGLPLFQITNKRGELISLRLFPLGGYCAFDGEEDQENEAKEGSFNSQKPWKRIIVFLAGVTMNFLTAILFSLILLCSIGYDIREVDKTSMSFNDGYTISTTDTGCSLQEGDVIFAVNGVNIDFAFSSTYQDLLKAELNKALELVKDVNNTDINKVEDYKITFSVRRNGEMIEVDDVCFTGYTYEVDGKNVTSYSIGISDKSYVYSFGEGLARCIPFAFGLAWVVFKSIWQLFTFQIAINEIGGTVTTIAVMAQATAINPASMLILIPLISANLAVFNLLPFPALDGAHVVFTTIEAIRGKPINRKIENLIHTIGLLILFGFVIIVDILHFVL